MWLSSTSQAYMYTVFDSVDSELDFYVIKNRLLWGLKLCASFICVVHFCRLWEWYQSQFNQG